MAKVGEGDPRWIVDERKDGANVNAWHWEERDLSAYVHDKLKKAFLSLKFLENQDGVVYAQIDNVSEILGDVTVAQRKGKMMCYFELKMTLQWSGKTSTGDDVVKGKLEVTEVDHDELMNDFNIDVTCQEKGKAAEMIENVARIAGRSKVREEIRKFFDTLYEEYHIGKMLKNNTVMPPLPVVQAPTPPFAKGGDEPAPAEVSESNIHSKPIESLLEWKMRWRVPIEQLFHLLVDERTSSLYTRSPAQVDAKTGGQFHYLGGVISGYFVNLQPPMVISEQWRLNSWPVGVHSSVVMRLVKEEPGVTILEFAQLGIPSGEMQNVKMGWRVNFFDAIRTFCGVSMEYI
ncbi:unnamed protein product [Phytomonas sp. Hart1]|nr:unnamed protein product [Phytomonas sp. Hart1]|eukprot:CCW69134.1 unnamed protein product [Phytomonas sp. isolate Hart1]